MEQLKKFFTDSGFSGVDLDQILNRFILKNYKKGEFYLNENSTCRHLGFVESGVFQYFIVVDGEERSTYVSVANSFVASLSSFIGQTPAFENIRCVADGAVWRISYADLQHLLTTIPGFKDFYIGLLEYQIRCIEQSRNDFIRLNAEQRYEKMLAEEPHLLQQIPLQYLASMLGVTPRHLSRIRNRRGR